MIRSAGSIVLRRLSQAFGLALLTVICSGGCGGEAVETQDEGESTPSRSVVTDKIRQEAVADEITLSAEVAPWAAVTVTAEVSGKVLVVPVEVGDQVSRGDALAELDSLDARAMLLQTEAVLQQVQATAAQAGRDVERAEKLAETNDISVGELDALVLARDTSLARVTEAEAALTLARERLDDTVVRAPFSGVVSDRSVEVGTWLSPGAPVVRVVDDGRVRVRAAASQTERARLELDMPAEIAATALPGTAFYGKVRVLGAEADEATGTYRVEAWVDAPEHDSGARLLSGMHATMVVEMNRIEGLWAPRAALLDTPDGTLVFVVEDKGVRAVFPRIGRMTPELVEILEGLEDGDEVVVQGHHVLSDGDQVSPS